ncbi:MAG: GNAT family N-acetyltransferase [Candidatus Aenigmatarchaeota archaeon]
MKVTEIDNTEDFFALKSVWNNLLRKSKDNNPFLTWEYLFTYWKHFGKNKELKILCLKNKNNEVVGITPLRLSCYKFANLLTYNVIEPLGLGGADYTGIIIPEQEEKRLKLIVNYLAAQKDWDFVYLYDIPEFSAATTLLNSASDSKMFPQIHRGAICPYITIPKSIEALLAMLKGKFRKNLRRCLKKLEEDYKRIELTNYKKFNSVEESMKVFFDLHQRRWRTKKLPGVFNSKETRNFFLDVAKTFAEKGWLALYFLMVNDQPVATQLCYEYSQKMCYVLGGFDPNFSQYSVGNIITLKILEKCIEKSIKEYDFLKGGEPYKFDWTNTYRTNLGFRFVNKKKITSKIYDLGIKTAKKTKIDLIIGKLLQF